jgi:hypothetical protein
MIETGFFSEQGFIVEHRRTLIERMWHCFVQQNELPCVVAQFENNETHPTLPETMPM